MLKRILLSVPILLCLSFSTASAEHWVRIVRPTEHKSTENSTFLDIDSIKKQGDTAIVWIKYTIDDTYRLQEKEYDKKGHSYSVLYEKVYVHNKLVSEGSPIANRQRIEPDTKDEYVYDFIW